MLFNILKLLGLDIRAEIAAVKGEIEQRVDEVTVRARRAALTAAVIVALSCTMALGVGLVALYRAEAATYGVDVALAVVAAVLVAAALILICIAWTMGKSLSGAPPLDNAGDVAAASAAQAAPSAATPPPAAAAGDITEPLAFVLALLTREPGLGHPVLDELVGKLRTPAGGKADEAVEQALNLVRNGDRTQLAVMLGAAALAGWLLAHGRPDPAPRDAAPQK